MAVFAGYDTNKIRNPELRTLFELIFDIAAGHDHDGSNTKLVTVGAPGAGTVDTAELAPDAVDGTKLADNAVDSEHYTDGSIDAVHLSTDSVETAKILNLNVTIGKLETAVQTSLGLADSALQSITVDEATPVNAVSSSGILTISGIVIDGETIAIGDDDYEFAADVAQSISGDFAIDITSFTTASAGTLTVDTQPTAGDDMTLGATTYIFVPDGTDNAADEITIGTDLASAQAAIVAAINGSDGHNSANASASAGAFAVNDSIITALIGGVAGDSIATTETFTAGTNVFDAATLGTTTAGVDCTAANAVTAIVAEITAHDTAGVGAVDGTGDTVDLTADTKGVAGDSITTTEAMANGSMGAATLESGVDGTVGVANEFKEDASYLYKCIETNTIADANWRRIDLGSAY